MEKKNNRKILEYFTCENKEHWLREIQKSDWGAGQYLYSLLKENKLKALVGATTLVLMLADGDKLVSFCTLAPLDDVQPTSYTPWVGFVYSKYNNFKMVFWSFAFVNLRFLIYIDLDFTVSIPAFFNMPISMKKVPV